MGLQSIHPTLWPGIVAPGASAAAAVGTDTTIDAAGEYQCYVFVAREAMVISHVGFRSGAVSGSPTADVRIETVNASDGLPSGALWATNTNIVTATLVATTTALHALTASATIAKGQTFAVKIVYNSGTSFVVQQISNTLVSHTNKPYQVQNTGTPTKARLSSVKILALGSSSTTFYSLYPTLSGITAVTHSTFDNTNSGARGLRFQIPFTARCVGIRHISATAVGDFAVALYDDAGAELSSSSTTFEGDQSAANAVGYNDEYFDNAVTLLPATWYRAAIVPNSATVVNSSTITLLSTDYLSGTPFKANAHYTTRASGTWDDSATTQIAYLDLLLDGLDDGVSAGGLNRALLHSGVSAVG